MRAFHDNRERIYTEPTYQPLIINKRILQKSRMLLSFVEIFLKYF